jgi:hypothetical protein
MHLAGCGTQTSALAFGGIVAPAGCYKQQQKNMMELLGQQEEI